jgi:hypothetical protein
MRVMVMEDKTPLYMLAIVGIVAVVAVIVMMTNGVNIAQDNAGITANVVYDQPRTNVNALSLNTFGKVFYVLFLAGIAAYFYFKRE